MAMIQLIVWLFIYFLSCHLCVLLFCVHVCMYLCLHLFYSLFGVDFIDALNRPNTKKKIKKKCIL